MKWPIVLIPNSPRVTLAGDILAFADPFQFRKVVLGEFDAALPAGIVLADLRGAELDPADLARDGLRQVLDELDPADALERRQLFSEVAEHVEGELARRDLARYERDERL